MKRGDWRKKAAEGLKTGDVFRFKRKFSREETEQFGRLTRDYNPVHYDDNFAGAHGFSELILHGLLVGGMICELGGQVAWLASGMQFKFIRPVFFDDEVECKVTITEVTDSGRAAADAEFTNQRGDQVMHASMTGVIPIAEKARALQQMLDAGDPTNEIAGDE